MNLKQYIKYLFRWAVLAVPGAWFLKLIQTIIPGLYIPMIVSQVLTGMWVYFIDKLIFKDRRVERVIEAAKEVVRCHYARGYSKYYKSLKIRDLQQTLDELREG